MDNVKKVFSNIGHFFKRIFVPLDEENPSYLNIWIKKESTQTIIASILCALLGLLLGFVVLLIISPAGAPKALSTLIKNFFTYKSSRLQIKYFGQTLVKTAPLILVGLSVLFAYKAGLFNIGVAGQYTVAIGISLYSALAWHLPWYVCVLLAMLAGALWGCLVGLLKAFRNVNEVISAIMLNWIGLYLVNILLSNKKVMNPSISETYRIANVSPKSMLPTLGLDKLFNNKYVTIGVILSVLVAILVYIVLNKTTFGYELKATGNNKYAAKYAGMKDKRNIILTMAISGALAGLSAAFYYLTDVSSWIVSSSVPSMGFDGISTAFLGGLNPIGVIFASYFIMHITEAGGSLNTQYYSAQISNLITSIIIYLCAFTLFFKQFMQKKLNKNNASKAKKEVSQ